MNSAQCIGAFRNTQHGISKVRNISALPDIWRHDIYRKICSQKLLICANEIVLACGYVRCYLLCQAVMLLPKNAALLVC